MDIEENIECPFCSSDINKLVLLQTELTLIIVNILPAAKGHLLVLPKRHVLNISELNSIEGNDLFSCLQIARGRLVKHLRPQGFNVFMNEGGIAGQTLEHLHWHVIPRNENDGLENFKRRPGERVDVAKSELIFLAKIFS
jgi:ATP adenylyltransferase